MCHVGKGKCTVGASSDIDPVPTATVGAGSSGHDAQEPTLTCLKKGTSKKPTEASSCQCALLSYSDPMPLTVVIFSLVLFTLPVVMWNIYHNDKCQPTDVQEHCININCAVMLSLYREKYCRTYISGGGSLGAIFHYAMWTSAFQRSYGKHSLTCKVS